MRDGVLGLGGSSFFGGGGGAGPGTAPIIPPSTPPGAPPATPPGTPPTTPALADGGGSSSSLISVMFFGTVLGAINLPASNWRGMTLTILTGAAAGGGGGGGGGGGTNRKLVNCVLGSASK